MYGHSWVSCHLCASDLFSSIFRAEWTFKLGEQSTEKSRPSRVIPWSREQGAGVKRGLLSLAYAAGPLAKVYLHVNLPERNTAMETFLKYCFYYVSFSLQGLSVTLCLRYRLLCRAPFCTLSPTLIISPRTPLIR